MAEQKAAVGKTGDLVVASAALQQFGGLPPLEHVPQAPTKPLEERLPPTHPRTTAPEGQGKHAQGAFRPGYRHRQDAAGIVTAFYPCGFATRLPRDHLAALLQRLAKQGVPPPFPARRTPAARSYRAQPLLGAGAHQHNATQRTQHAGRHSKNAVHEDVRLLALTQPAVQAAQRARCTHTRRNEAATPPNALLARPR